MEKGKTVSRTVIQQRTVEQIVGSPAAKVVELVPQMIVQLVDVPQTVSWGRIRQRADERINDPPVPKVVNVWKSASPMCLCRGREEKLVEVPKTVSRDTSQRVDEQIVDRIFRSIAV